MITLNNDENSSDHDTNEISDDKNDHSSDSNDYDIYIFCSNSINNDGSGTLGSKFPKQVF